MHHYQTCTPWYHPHDDSLGRTPLVCAISGAPVCSYSGSPHPLQSDFHLLYFVRACTIPRLASPAPQATVFFIALANINKRYYYTLDNVISQGAKRQSHCQNFHNEIQPLTKKSQTLSCEKHCFMLYYKQEDNRPPRWVARKKSRKSHSVTGQSSGVVFLCP